MGLWEAWLGIKETTRDWQEESPIAAKRRRIPRIRRKEGGPAIRRCLRVRISDDPVCAVIMRYVDKREVDCYPIRQAAATYFGIIGTIAGNVKTGRQGGFLWQRADTG